MNIRNRLWRWKRWKWSSIKWKGRISLPSPRLEWCWRDVHLPRRIDNCFQVSKKWRSWFNWNSRATLTKGSRASATASSLEPINKGLRNRWNIRKTAMLLMEVWTLNAMSLTKETDPRLPAFLRCKIKCISLRMSSTSKGTSRKAARSQNIRVPWKYRTLDPIDTTKGSC